MPPGFVCTHCGVALKDKRGRPAEQLYDVDLFKKSRIIRLLDCPGSGSGSGSGSGIVADPYPEYEGTQVLIDLILQSKPAYRHVLYNEPAYHQIVLKMALLAVIVDGYIGWAATPAKGEFFEQEYLFYVVCSKASMGLAAYISIALLSSLLTEWFSNCPTWSDLRTSLVGLLMAYSTRFFNLAALLWASPMSGGDGDGDGDGDEARSAVPTAFGWEPMWAFVYLLYFVATVRVLQVSRHRSLPSSLAIAFVAHCGFNLLLHLDRLLLLLDPDADADNDADINCLLNTAPDPS